MKFYSTTFVVPFLISILIFSPPIFSQTGGSSLNLNNADYLTHGDFVDFGSVDYGFQNQVTVAAWIRWTTNPQTYSNAHSEKEGRFANIVTIDRHNTRDLGQFWMQHTSSNNNFQFAVRTTNNRISVNSSTVPAKDKWVFLTGVYDASDPDKRLKLYVNGVLEGQTGDLTGTINPHNEADLLSIGRLPNGYRLFSGRVEEVRIWKGALTQEQIRQQMFSKATVDPGGTLASYWSMDEGSGTIIGDTGPKNASGTFYTALVDVHSFTPEYMIFDDDKSWPQDGWSGKTIRTVAGDGIGETNIVQTNGPTSILLGSPWITEPRLDDLGGNTGMTWYGIEDPNESGQWMPSTAPICDNVAFVKTTTPTTVGPEGGSIRVTITSTPGTNDNLGVYQYGQLDGQPVSSGETFPAGVIRRASDIWGVSEWGNVTATLQFKFSSIAGITDPTTVKLLIRNRDSNNWSEVTNALRDPAARTFTIVGATSFGEYSIGAGLDNPLPVELRGLTARIVKEGVLLEWNTATEVNNYGFEIQRKVAEGSWSAIGFTEGRGTVNAPSHYQFIDGQAPRNASYRLRQIDRDGKNTYSSVVTATTAAAPLQFSLEQNYPNPFKVRTTIPFSISRAEAVSLVVYNIIGQEVARIRNTEVMPAGRHLITFDASKLASGSYFVTLRTGAGVVHRRMMIAK